MFEVIEDAPFFITVPDLPLLDAAEGFALAASAFKPHFKEIVTGRRKAAILIPEDRPPFTPNLKSRSITEAFFTGMFQEFLTALREEYFPELKFEAAREGLHIVGGTAPIPLTARDKLALAFGSPSWDTYDALQEIFWEKISVGILHADGSTTLADISPEGDFLNDTDAPHSAPLYQWVHQLANGLDLAFKSDLKFAAPSPRPTTGANPPFIPG